MIEVLAIVLLILIYTIGGERGIISLLALVGNILVVLASLLIMGWGINPLLVTITGCIIISTITLFYQNGKNAKTIAAFISVIIVIVLLVLIVYKFGVISNIGGFNEIRVRQDDMMELSKDINTNMISIAISVIIIGLIGAIMDTAIAISSAVYEVFRNNRNLNEKQLFSSGISIGKDILGTTANTLFFAFIGESLMLFIYYMNYNYSFLDIINSKSFFQEFINIIFSAIGCVIIIPTVSFIIAYILKRPNKFLKILKEDELFNDNKETRELD